MMSESTVKVVDRAINIGAVFAEVVCPIFTWNEQDVDT